jgi:CHASE3 domain sensor protein
MLTNPQQRPNKVISQVQREKQKLEDELQALVEEIGKTMKDKQEWKDHLSKRQSEIIAQIKKLNQEIDSVGGMSAQMISKVRRSDGSRFSSYVTAAIIALACVGFFYLLFVWLS